MLTRRPRKSIRARGQATIEFAMILPIIVVLVLGMQTVGVQITNEVDLTAAASAGAEAAANTVDEINAVLSCTSPATPVCVKSGQDIFRRIVDDQLPCPGPDCVGAVRDLFKIGLKWGAPLCTWFDTSGRGGGCMIPTYLINSFSSLSACVATCSRDVDNFAKDLIAAGLGCTTADGSSCQCDPAHNCRKEVWVEVIADFTQLGTACQAVRRVLHLDNSVRTCINDPTQTHHDDPWIKASFGGPGLPAGVPFMYYTCVPTGGVDVHLFRSICNSGSDVLVEKLEVHYEKQKLVAVADAVPDSQFTGN